MTVSERCPTCNSPQPHLHPAVQYEGEIQPCSDVWHTGVGAPEQYAPMLRRASAFHPPADANRVMELERALRPFAEVGAKFAPHCAPNKAWPPEVSARFMDLQPLQVQHFVAAAEALAPSTDRETTGQTPLVENLVHSLRCDYIAPKASHVKFDV